MKSVYDGWTNAETWAIVTMTDHDENLLKQVLNLVRDSKDDIVIKKLLSFYSVRGLMVFDFAPHIWIGANLKDVNWTEVKTHFEEKLK